MNGPKNTFSFFSFFFFFFCATGVGVTCYSSEGGVGHKIFDHQEKGYKRSTEVFLEIHDPLVKKNIDPLKTTSSYLLCSSPIR